MFNTVQITDSLVLITKMYFKSQIIILDLCFNASDFSMKYVFLYFSYLLWVTYRGGGGGGVFNI